MNIDNMNLQVVLRLFIILIHLEEKNQNCLKKMSMQYSNRFSGILETLTIFH